MRQMVALKGLKDGIAVHIDEHADFVELLEALRQKVADGKRFFDGASTRVFFRGRKLSQEEEDALLGIISKVAKVSPASLEPSFETELQTDEPAKEEADIGEPELPKGALSMNFTESNCAFLKGGLRSGQSFKYSGSVVVMGDVNPGSEVVADGNVVVLGSLKGLAHAGAGGDESCIVLANALLPVQLRIGGVISSMPSRQPKNRQLKLKRIGGFSCISRQPDLRFFFSDCLWRSCRAVRPIPNFGTNIWICFRTMSAAETWSTPSIWGIASTTLCLRL